MHVFKVCGFDCLYQANGLEKEGTALMLPALWPNKCCIGNNQPVQLSLFCLATGGIFFSWQG